MSSAMTVPQDGRLSMHVDMPCHEDCTRIRMQPTYAVRLPDTESYHQHGNTASMASAGGRPCVSAEPQCSFPFATESQPRATHRSFIWNPNFHGTSSSPEGSRSELGPPPLAAAQAQVPLGARHAAASLRRLRVCSAMTGFGPRKKVRPLHAASMAIGLRQLAGWRAAAWNVTPTVAAAGVAAVAATSLPKPPKPQAMAAGARRVAAAAPEPRVSMSPSKLSETVLRAARGVGAGPAMRTGASTVSRRDHLALSRPRRKRNRFGTSGVLSSEQQAAADAAPRRLYLRLRMRNLRILGRHAPGGVTSREARTTGPS
eukprot:355081-Chlamydomonas_euryale.AAC.3